MPNNPIRRSQLIAPFGVGAMTVVQGGIGLITAGLDHWYKREDNAQKVDINEYIVEEWRLQRLLDVDYFRLPPDYREKAVIGQDVPNTGLTIPFLRFPQYHFCPRCHRLDERPLTERGRPKCPDCTNTSYLFQVPFVAMCEAGHLQDFPWREWVHKESPSRCIEKLRLVSTGSASLSGQRVKCDCGASRGLGSITEANPDQTTFLSKNLLENGEIFYCKGFKPWLGSDDSDGCSCHLRGALRSASNVYFAHVKSSIYLPRESDIVSEDLVALFEQPPLSTLAKTLFEATEMLPLDIRMSTLLNGLRRQYPLIIDQYNDEQIRKTAIVALEILTENPADVVAETNEDDEDIEIRFRREEYEVLRKPRDGNLLSIKELPLDKYMPPVTQFFSKIMLIDKLRETRALAGFTRVFAENEQTAEDRRAVLRRREAPDDNWLPAYVVYGEGIYFELEESQLQIWERQENVTQWVKRLEDRYLAVQQKRRLRHQDISPRFVLLHTLAHLVMNRLTFECGYSSAALRERLYVSTNPAGPMAGVLIYTADGDAEGTMGGLVRMGKPTYFEPVIRRALQNAIWCSSDPVCMEIGGSGGQGPDSCNLAACHNCALVPETACEHFNRFLDRAVVIGSMDKSAIGYFHIDEL